MKKSLIAASAASLAVAAMPIVGVFAEDSSLNQTDTVVLTIASACSLATSATGDYTVTIPNGQYNTNIGGSTFTITCNDYQGWKLNAVGNGTATGDVTKMDASTQDADDIPTGTTLNGSVSNWAFKLAPGTGEHAGATIVTGSDDFSDFHAVPSVSTKVAYGTTSAGTQTVIATYGIGVSSTQNQGTYTGKVQYTLAHPNT